MSKTSFPKGKINILLLENIHPVAIEAFKEQGFHVETMASSLSEQQLIEKIPNIHIIGIRSKTKMTKPVLSVAKKLLAVGCFCIGTDQVDLEAAGELGIPVFNSPFMNSRSVAELIIAQIIMLSRQLGDRNTEMHNGSWKKTANKCYEIRGKTLGIIGYGHIGTQLSVLADAMGMEVKFFDIVDKLPIGRATVCKSLDELLESSDFVTCHVPDTEETREMITAKELAKMKPGSYLLNASRGKVVVIPDLVAALNSGHIQGAYVDVYPVEPAANCDDWTNELQKCRNTTLTPHIGGSTEEAQEAIGHDVSGRLLNFINSGLTGGAVNFPNIEHPFTSSDSVHRICYTHLNQPGVLRDVNKILDVGNVVKQILETNSHVGYLIADVDSDKSRELKKMVQGLPSNLKTRLLF